MIRAQRAVFARAQLSFDAARNKGFPAEFRTWENGNVLAKLTTAPELSFLNAITLVGETSEQELRDALDVFTQAIVPPPDIIVLHDEPGIAAHLTACGLSRGTLRPLAVFDCRNKNPTDSAMSDSSLIVRKATSDKERDLLLEVLVKGYACAPAVSDFIRMEHSCQEITGYLAWIDDVPVAAAALSWHDGCAVLGGASTVAKYRGQGAQRALLHARLDDVAKDSEGNRIAAVTAAPDSASLRNIQRAGFKTIMRQSWKLSD